MALSTEGFGSGFMGGFKVMGDYFDKKRERERQEKQDKIAAEDRQFNRSRLNRADDLAEERFSYQQDQDETQKEQWENTHDLSKKQEKRLQRTADESERASKQSRNKKFVDEQMRMWNHERNQLVKKHQDGGSVTSRDFSEINNKFDKRLADNGISTFTFADQDNPERFAAIEDSIKLMGELAQGDADVYKSGASWKKQDALEERITGNLNKVLHRDINNGFGADKKIVGVINGEEIDPKYAGSFFAEIEYTDPESGQRVTAPLTWDRSNSPDDNPRPISINDLMNRIGGEYVVGKMAKNGRDLLVSMGLEKDEEKLTSKAAKKTAQARYESAMDTYNDAHKAYAKAATDFKKSTEGQQMTEESPEDYIARVNMAVAEAHERFRNAAIGVNSAEAAMGKLDDREYGRFGVSRKPSKKRPEVSGTSYPSKVKSAKSSAKNDGGKIHPNTLSRDDMEHKQAKEAARDEALNSVKAENSDIAETLNNMTQGERIAWWEANAERVTNDLPSESAAYITSLIFGKE